MVKRVLHIRADISAQNPIAGAEMVIKNYIHFMDVPFIESYLCLCAQDQKTGEVLSRFFDLPDDRIFLFSSFSSKTMFKLDFWKRLIQLIHDYQIDIIHSHSYKSDLMALVLKIMTGKIIISTVHGYNPPSNTFKSRIIWGFMRRIWFFFDLTILVSDSQINIPIFKTLARSGKIAIIRNFIPEVHIANSFLNNEPRPFTLLCIGRLAYEKNQILLLKALQKLDPERMYKCHIIGDGPDKDQLNEYLSNAGLKCRVSLEGFLSPNVLNEYYQKADVLVITSLFEALPIVMLEAMANRCVVIAPSFGEFELALAEGRGYLYKTNDADDLAEKIISAMDHPDALKNAAEKSINEFRLKYSADVNSKALRLVYSNLFNR